LNRGIPEILKSFSTITLEEMESVKLMDRTDTKFVFNACCLPVILNEMIEHYKALEVNGTIPNRYETLYFDSENLDFYRQHHNGKSNRYKIRYRQYVESELNFFEIKFRSNKGRTIKERVKRKRIHEDIEGKAESLLLERTVLDPGWLKPQLWVYYKRMTFVNKTASERLTIDFDLNYKDEKNTVSYPGLVIAEVKQEKAKLSPFIVIMRKHRISSDTISKYCLGILSLKENVKTNCFKMKLRTINKLCHDKN
jgi:hypothetical protein